MTLYVTDNKTDSDVILVSTVHLSVKPYLNYSSAVEVIQTGRDPNTQAS